MAAVDLSALLRSGTSGAAPKTTLSGDEETSFREWYKGQADQLGLNEDPDDPQHFYDYRAAWKSGVRAPNAEGHWPSQFKLEGHPNLVVGGVDTRTGDPAGPKPTTFEEFQADARRAGWTDEQVATGWATLQREPGSDLAVKPKPSVGGTIDISSALKSEAPKGILSRGVQAAGKAAEVLGRGARALLPMPAVESPPAPAPSLAKPIPPSVDPPVRPETTSLIPSGTSVQRSPNAPSIVPEARTVGEIGGEPLRGKPAAPGEAPATPPEITSLAQAASLMRNLPGTTVVPGEGGVPAPAPSLVPRVAVVGRAGGGEEPTLRTPITGPEADQDLEAAAQAEIARQGELARRGMAEPTPLGSVTVGLTPPERALASTMRAAIAGVRGSAVGSAARFISNQIDDRLGRPRTSGPVEATEGSLLESAVEMLASLGTDIGVLGLGARAGRAAVAPVINAMAQRWFAIARATGMSVDDAAIAVQRAVGNSAAVRRLVEANVPRWTAEARSAGLGAEEAAQAAREAGRRLIEGVQVATSVKAVARAGALGGAVGLTDAAREAARQLADEGGITDPGKVAKELATGTTTGGVIGAGGAPITSEGLQLLVQAVGWGVVAPLIKGGRLPTPQDLVLAGIPAAVIHLATRGAASRPEILPAGEAPRGTRVGAGETRPRPSTPAVEQPPEPVAAVPGQGDLLADQLQRTVVDAGGVFRGIHRDRQGVPTHVVFDEPKYGSTLYLALKGGVTTDVIRSAVDAKRREFEEAEQRLAAPTEPAAVQPTEQAPPESPTASVGQVTAVESAPSEASSARSSAEAPTPGPVDLTGALRTEGAQPPPKTETTPESAPQGYTKIGRADYGILPDQKVWSRGVYTTGGDYGRVVGEDAENFYVAHQAGSMARVAKYPKEFIERNQDYWKIGSQIQTREGPATITESPRLNDQGYRTLGVRFEDGTEKKIPARVPFVTNMPMPRQAVSVVGPEPNATTASVPSVELWIPKPDVQSGFEPVAKASAALLNKLMSDFGGQWPSGIPVGLQTEIQTLREALRRAGVKRAPQGSNLEAEAKRWVARVPRETMPSAPSAATIPVVEGFDPNDPVQLSRFVRARGGIAPSPSGDLVGEYKIIPFAVKNRYGLSPDLMAQAVSEAAGRPVSDAELLDLLAHRGRLIERATTRLGTEAASQDRAAQREQESRDLAALPDDEKARRIAAMTGVTEAQALRAIQRERPLAPEVLASNAATHLAEGWRAPLGSAPRLRALDLTDWIEETVDAAGDADIARQMIQALPDDATAETPGRRGTPPIRLTKTDQAALLEAVFPKGVMLRGDRPDASGRGEGGLPGGPSGSGAATVGTPPSEARAARGSPEAASAGGVEPAPEPGATTSSLVAPPRFERTTLGDQGLIPGAEARQIPTTPLRPEVPQKPVGETPLFRTEPEVEQPELPGAEEGPAFEATRAALEPVPPFFSALQRAIEEKMPAQALPAQVGSIIKGPGVKAEEVKWSGLDDWLASKKGQEVAKAEVLDFLRANEMRVEEVMLGESVTPGAAMPMGPLTWRQGGGEWIAETATSHAIIRHRPERGARPYILNAGNIQNVGYRSLAEAQRGAEEGILPDEVTAERPTKFSGYVLHGAESGTYRELLLTLPARSQAASFEEWQQRRGYYPTTDAGELAQRRQVYESGLSPEPEQATGATYRSPHWDEPNVLAHVRFNERTDAEGKRVLFLEELQSDWHQQGRRRGYRQQLQNEPELIAERNELSQRADEMLLEARRRGGRGDYKETMRAWPEKADEHERIVTRHNEINGLLGEAQAGVPPAPFAKTWHELALKRMLRYASEHGYDRLAWTTGEQQAARYDLSKYVRSIDHSHNADGTYNIIAREREEGAHVIHQYDIPPEKLSDLVGKDIADKITRGEGRESDIRNAGVPWKTLSGVELKVGGEGMRGFYDTILPGFLNKYAKKWGARVGETTIETLPKPSEYGGGYAERVPAIDITPAMRQSVLHEGQPLFMPRPTVETGLPAGTRLREFDNPAGHFFQVVWEDGGAVGLAARTRAEAIRDAVRQIGRERTATVQDVAGRQEMARRFHRAFQSGVPVPGEGRYRVADTAERLRPDQVQALASATYLGDLGRHLDDALDTILALAQYEEAGLGQGAYLYGFSPDPTYFGVNQRIGGSRDAIALNPWALARSVQTYIDNGLIDERQAPTELARLLLRTLTHEATHVAVRQHAAPFEVEFALNVERTREAVRDAEGRLAAGLAGEGPRGSGTVWTHLETVSRTIPGLVSRVSGEPYAPSSEALVGGRFGPLGERGRGTPESRVAPSRPGPARPGPAAGVGPEADLRRGGEGAAGELPGPALMARSEPEPRTVAEYVARGWERVPDARGRAFYDPDTAEQLARDLRTKGYATSVQRLNPYIRSLWAKQPTPAVATPEAPPDRSAWGRQGAPAPPAASGGGAGTGTPTEPPPAPPDGPMEPPPEGEGQEPRVPAEVGTDPPPLPKTPGIVNPPTVGGRQAAGVFNPNVPATHRPQVTYLRRLRRQIAEKFPRDFAIARRIPDSPVISLIERHSSALSDDLENAINLPFHDAIVSHDEEAWVKLEREAVEAWHAGGETDDAYRDAVRALPAAFQDMLAYRASRFGQDQAARRSLGLRLLPERSEPYFPRLTDEDYREAVRFFHSPSDLGADLQQGVKTFQRQRVFDTMADGQAQGVVYEDPRLAWLLREWNSIKLQRTAELMQALAGTVLFETRAEALAASPTGDVLSVEGLPGRPERWWARSREEALFLRDNLTRREGGLRIPGLGNATFVMNQLFRNPNLYNPLPHFLRNMLYKYGLSTVSHRSNPLRVAQDMVEFFRRSNPTEISQYRELMSWSRSGRLAYDILHEAMGRGLLDRAIHLVGVLNRPSSRMIFQYLDPALRYADYRAYRRQGMEPQNAANQAWIDLIRYSTRSELVDEWKQIPGNFYVPWRLGTVTSLTKALRTGAIASAVFILTIDLLRDWYYRRTGNWLHLPIDYVEKPIALVMEKPLSKEAWAVAATSAIFGPGGEATARLIADGMQGITNPGDRQRLLNAFWGISQAVNMTAEVRAYRRDGDAQHLVNVLTSAALGTHAALAYRPKRLLSGDWLPTWLGESDRVSALRNLGKSSEVLAAEYLQDIRQQRREQQAQRKANQHGNVLEQLQRSFERTESERQLEQLERSSRGR